MALSNVLDFVASAVADGGTEPDVAREAERLAGKSGVEYHPLVCDAVVAAFPDPDAADNAPPRRCDHVSQAKRKAAEAAIPKAEGQEG